MLNWRRSDERLKDMSCRVAMLRMQDDGLLHLPKPQNGNNNGRRYCRRTSQADPKLFPVNGSAGNLVDLHLELVTERSQSHLWNEYIDRYHYLVPSQAYIDGFGFRKSPLKKGVWGIINMKNCASRRRESPRPPLRKGEIFVSVTERLTVH
jgi:hypothetical protein